MAKFKVGDKVRVIGADAGNYLSDDATILKVYGDEDDPKYDFKGPDRKGGVWSDKTNYAMESDIELITEVNKLDTMNMIKKEAMPKDEATLVEAGYLNENLEVTTLGSEAIQFITYQEKKAELVKMAKARLAEIKAAK